MHEVILLYNLTDFSVTMPSLINILKLFFGVSWKCICNFQTNFYIVLLETIEHIL